VAHSPKTQKLQGDFGWLAYQRQKKEKFMSGNADKTKFSIRVNTQLLELADAYIRDSTVQNRTELIEDALRFYLGFLTSKKAEDYLLQALSSVMTGTVQDSENRLARMDFKLAVELSKLAHVIAYTHEVDEDALHKLHLKCVEEVKRINGAIDFESAYKYQKRES
jgi:metal-responsive CopG/Arc/MetJ family transcriptional regulator